MQSVIQSVNILSLKVQSTAPQKSKCWESAEFVPRTAPRAFYQEGQQICHHVLARGESVIYIK